MAGHIILSHGSDSGPAATKVSALAGVAESLGWSTERPDFGDCDVAGLAESVTPRIERLVERMHAVATPPILVGSSMGAFVSGLASLEAPCAGLFLLALPTEIPGYLSTFDMAQDVPCMLIHGFDDDVCSPDAALAFARQRGMPSLLVTDGHRLAEHVEVVMAQFRLFLERVAV